MNEIEKVARILEGVGRINREHQEFMGKGDDGLTVVSAVLLELCVERLRKAANLPALLVPHRAPSRGETGRREIVVGELLSAEHIADGVVPYWDIWDTKGERSNGAGNADLVLGLKEFPAGSIVKVYETKGG